MMSRTVLGCLGSYANVNGDEAVGRRVPRERAHVERQAMRMAERREETWRRLSRDRVAAFLELFLMAMVYRENAHRSGHQSKASAKMLNKALVHRIIPWMNRNRVWMRDESQWPMTLGQFQELDQHLVAHLPQVRSDYRWQNIVYFLKKENDKGKSGNDWMNWRGEAMEAYQRCMANLNN